MNFQTMSKQRKFVLILSAIGVISMFLPWVRVSVFGFSQSVNGIHGVGIVVFLCFVVAAITAYIGDQTKNLDKSTWLIVLVCGALATIIVLWNIIDASSGIMGSFLGFGIYLSGLAAIAVLLSAFLLRSPADNIKDSFESLKNDINRKMKTPSSDINRSDTFSDKHESSDYVKDVKDIDNPGNANPPL
jgi:hypothetical protein